MKAKRFLAGVMCLTLVCTTVLSACGKKEEAPAATPAPTESLAPAPSLCPDTPGPTDTPLPVEPPEETAAPEPMVITAGSREELKNAMAGAIERLSLIHI